MREEDAEVLHTLARLNICYLDHCVFGGGELSELEKRIQKVLFPKIENEYSEYCERKGLASDSRTAWRKWVNAKCDVLALWSHIWYEGDIFVTTDKNSHKKTKKPRIIELGAGEILHPYEASEFIRTRKERP